MQNYFEDREQVDTVAMRSARQAHPGVAERENVDLIAIASHGETGLAHLHGNVALGLLHRTDRPVLVIRSDGLWAGQSGVSIEFQRHGNAFAQRR
jgi:nucleotide-binding universal stress UspA family protein